MFGCIPLLNMPESDGVKLMLCNKLQTSKRKTNIDCPGTQPALDTILLAEETAANLYFVAFIYAIMYLNRCI